MHKQVNNKIQLRRIREKFSCTGNKEIVMLEFGGRAADPSDLIKNLSMIGDI